MDVKIEESWRLCLQDEFDKPYFSELSNFIRSEYQTKKIFPPASLIFNAMDSCPFERVKVVILGQDPYHGVGQAHGLCFSVPDGVEVPPSLVNIFKEIERTSGKTSIRGGNLTSWAAQGVLLLNASLTVEAHKAGSHQGQGWEVFTDAIVRKLAEAHHNLVFMLWGSYAQKKGACIDANRHLVLKSVHPSPLSAYRGFSGNNHFVMANEYLQKHGRQPIEW